ncbi:MAG: NAD(P)-binding domain-containing protein [Phycisphaerales bacterium]|nr:NAD(P)-binding domain-containing protein [Phycisphaerae bacterium]NNF41722.1 NAD(P)-binding domain-containing protein [Phycisphaerales bacterium]NNM25577.1 NAD(P)-binding domain-containing protein [Phycisphaerales bacterium]
MIDDAPIDMLIVGAGPVGIELACAARDADLGVRVLEAGVLGDSIFHWPAGTRFLSSPERVAIAGVPVQSMLQEPMAREEYLAYLRSVVEMRRLDLWCHTPVNRIDCAHDHVTAVTGGRHPGRHDAGRIVFATGRLAQPSRLDVPGASEPHVHHRMRDPHFYFGQRVVVVGDGNGALAAAGRLWRAGADVSIVYRGETLDEAWNRAELLADINMLIDKGNIEGHGAHEVAAIFPHEITLRPLTGNDANPRRVEADFVVVEIGFNPDNSLLESCGVDFDDEGVPDHDPQSMCTNVPRVHVVGTVVAPSNEMTAIVHGREHIVRLIRSITGDTPVVGGAARRRYAFTCGDDAPA